MKQRAPTSICLGGLAAILASAAGPASGAREQEPPAATAAPAAIGTVRIKDIADVQGVRGNQLVGYGLVVGLDGTGDGQNAQFTVNSVANMLRSFNVIVPRGNTQVKNVAAVIVTADLPAFVKKGSRVDVLVSSLGDARSLQGGTLVQTPLLAANGSVYAVAQGPLSIGGFNFSQGGSSVQKNHVTVGRIPHGAYVEQEVPTTLMEGNSVRLTLRDPDFTTARRVAEALREQIRESAARPQDAGTVAVSVPAGEAADLIGYIARIESVRVTPDTQARIIVNERTGTIVIGGSVRLGPGVIAHGAISVRIENTPLAIPAPPFSRGTPPVVVPFKDTRAQEKGAQLAAVPATTTIEQLARALNALGVTPRDLIIILQAMHAAGMLSGELTIQ